MTGWERWGGIVLVTIGLTLIGSMVKRVELEPVTVTMLAIALKDPEIEDPKPSDFYPIGTEIGVGRLMHLPDGSVSIMAQGRNRAEIVEFIQEDGYLRAKARPIEEIVKVLPFPDQHHK